MRVSRRSFCEHRGSDTGDARERKNRREPITACLGAGGRWVCVWNYMSQTAALTVRRNEEFEATVVDPTGEFILRPPSLGR